MSSYRFTVVVFPPFQSKIFSSNQQVLLSSSRETRFCLDKKQKWFSLCKEKLFWIASLEIVTYNETNVVLFGWLVWLLVTSSLAKWIVFAYGPGDLGSIPGRVIPKTLKMVLYTSLVKTHQYKVCIKGKVEQLRERSSTLSYTLV